MEKSEFIKKLAEHAKKKHDLKGISDEFVIGAIASRCPSNLMNLAESHNFAKIEKSREYRAFFKSLRKFLRESYGLFVSGEYSKRKKVLEMLEKEPSIENHLKMLKLHASTKERIEYYEMIYQQIFSITGKPEVILDLGCGLNPFSHPFLDCKPGYLACEISESDCTLIQKYFDTFGIDGTCFCFDLTKFKKTRFSGYFPVDICLMLKIVDTIENESLGITEKLLDGINCRYFVVSFSTVSMGGKKSLGKRGWFERLLAKKSLAFEKFSVPNETFYIIKTSY